MTGRMKALEDITVLDLSRILSGPFCTQMLSDLGATVWKIESPRGDDTRRWGPPFVSGESAYYLSTNRGKKSVVVNLKEPQGQDLVRRLARRADVLVENFKVGDLARYGLDYDSVSRVNPRLVYASITGFGQTGPRAKEPGYDVALQALTGIMGVTGEPDGPPVRVGVAWIDLLTGLTTAIGILAALKVREQTGKGQNLDLSLFEVGLASMVNLAQDYLLTGVSPVRLGSAHPQIVPYQAFETRDGWFVLAVGSDERFRQMAGAIGHPELWEDERFQTNAGRVAHRNELVSQLVEVFRGDTRSRWLDAMARAGVPASPINSLAEAIHDPQARARRTVWEVPHPAQDDMPLMASALQHMSQTPASPQGHPPLLGEHTREVLTDAIGLAPSELADLERKGVVLCGPGPARQGDERD